MPSARQGRAARPARAVRRAAVLAAGAALLAPLAAAPASAAPSGAPAGAQGAGYDRYATVQILGINDFHGQLEPPTGSSSRLTVLGPDGQTPQTLEPVGGAEYLATHVKQLRRDRDQDYSVFVSAGDNIGGTPFLSAAAKDEPTVEFLNGLGLFASSTGNHEYDEGLAELRRIQDGGCHPTEGCFGGDGFAGADFTYLSANVVDEDTGRLVMPASAVKRFPKGVKVGFIGVPLKETPTIVSASAIAGLQFTDEVAAIAKASKELARRGVEAQVLLLHQGDSTGVALNTCSTLPGAAGTIARLAAAEVDAVFTGHSHQQYNCVVQGPDGRSRPVVQGAANGRIVSEIDLTIDRRANDVVRPLTEALNHPVTRDVRPDRATTRLIAKYAEAIAPIAGREVGTIGGDITRAADAEGETPLGDLIADAQLAATQDEGAQVALMNPGGVRADLVAAESADGEAPGVVTYREAFTVQPFGNVLVTQTMTGEELVAVLEQQEETGRLLQPSSTLTYALAADGTVSDVRIAGEPVDPAASYRVTVNNFLADGGDGFTTLTEGEDRVYGAVDLDAFTDYLAANPGVTAPATDRVRPAG
ncbi:bifunctional metallophosphatase/5'-nucleotidase [Vallicoccus soli]|uniref:Bifunctional metallophosphatase/5'-nucleotidase n=1 Tax=Vallicoccus soli TaxID=2339232 RepID=A0A3A3ZG72_9ACTN|nr:bifunctional metallophosphatase/5'-nucleotidase [Vallicoccus soli]RJK94196.1 bifunctional metallophosphatase/5'-nucleotidase [Vallicoccus soli]